MKNLLLSISLFATIYASAQPVFTWVRPPYGTTKTYNMYQGTMTEPSTGANQVWDYSAHNPISIGAGVYTDPSTLPASSLNKFPTATYVEVWKIPAAPSLDKAIIDYYQECTDSLVRLGQQGSGGGLANTWGDVQGIWNLAYGDSADARYFIYSNQLTTGKITYAAYGTLKTKYGVYTNVVMLSRNGGRAFFQTTPYVGMLMEIQYSAPNTIAGAYIYSYAGAAGIEDLKPQHKASVYSISNSKEVKISMADYTGKVGVKVYDALGKEVFQNTLYFSNDSQNIDLHNLLHGIYFVQVRYENFIQTEKVIINQ